jgi:hypothetical protein
VIFDLEEVAGVEHQPGGDGGLSRHAANRPWVRSPARARVDPAR